MDSEKKAEIQSAGAPHAVAALHPTAKKLLDTAVELLDSTSIDEVTIQLVLGRSGVSYGSLYHHFSDISDLVEQAIVYRYTRSVKDSIGQVRQLLDSDSFEHFKGRAEILIAQSVSDSRRKNRVERVAMLGAVQTKERLAAQIARTQHELTQEHAKVIREFQARGWVRDDVDAELLSVFVQALVVGRIVDDISEARRTDEEWSGLALPMFRMMLFPPD